MSPRGKARECKGHDRLYQGVWRVPGQAAKKQYLNWTLPRFQTAECCDRWVLTVQPLITFAWDNS